MGKLWRHMWGLDKAKKDDYIKILFWYVYKRLIMASFPVIFALVYFIYNYMVVK